ncbi:MAG: glycosyl hydrolase family 9, cellulase [Ruminococcus sp.]|nr:glycosyl hydrolase family 9, cellulase [Ruminococcus sp.]
MKINTLKRSLAALTACLVLSAGTTMMPITSTAASNIISNSTFDSGTTDWGIYKESGGKATLSTENGKLAMTVTDLGSLNYAVQLFYDIVPLYQNGVYRLSFEISSTVDRYVEAMIQQNGGTYQAYTWMGLDISSTPQTINHEFTMEAETDIMSKFCFNCGDQGDALGEHKIYLDNVVLELVDDSNVNYSSFMPYEPDIMTNQVGYKPDAKKTAVFRNVSGETSFSVVNADTKAVVHTGELYGETENLYAEEFDWLGDFSAVTEPGKYYITCGNLDDSYEFEIAEDVYGNLLDDSVKMLYLQRCGCQVVDSDFGHPACHTSKATIYGTSQTIDVSGGWHDAGDYGRYVVPAAKTIADLLYAYEKAPDLYGDNTGIPESGNGTPDILDEARYELEWMLKMQAESGGVYHKVSCATFPGYIMPQGETGKLIVTPVSTTATADFCASMALAYEFYYDIDKNFAENCLAAAEKAWAFLDANPKIIFKNPEDIVTGSYEDTKDVDERYWAAAQMYRATGSQTYLDYLNSTSAKTGLDWSTVGDYGNIALLTMKGIDKTSKAYTNALSAVKQQADGFAAVSKYNPYGVSLNVFNWGSNMTVANAGIILGLYYDITGDETYNTAANANLHYLLGKNPNGVCYMTGYGTVSPLNPHHRPSMAVGKAMKGMLVGGVNSRLEDSAAKAYLANSPSAKRYVDHSESYSTNEITIYWNSPLTYLLSLTEKAGNTSSVKGDVNADGEFGVADVVAMNYYLVIREHDLIDWQAGDLCEDGVIDSFDLVAMRKLLAENS